MLYAQSVSKIIETKQKNKKTKSGALTSLDVLGAVDECEELRVRRSSALSNRINSPFLRGIIVHNVLVTYRSGM